MNLIWKKSHGSLKYLVQYKETQKTHVFPEKELFEKCNSKVCLITAVAGMGKTTILTNISQRTPKDKTITIRIDLCDYDGFFVKAKQKEVQITTPIEAVDFLLDMLQSCIEDDFEQELIRINFLEVGNIVLFCDGYDEIYLEHETFLINFLSLLSESHVDRILITSRPNAITNLQQHFCILGYHLNQFTDENQQSFLANLFTKKLGLNSDYKDRLEIYNKAILARLSESLNDKEKCLTGIPLQLMLLGTIFADSNSSVSGFESCREFLESDNDTPNLPEVLDLIFLYDNCVKSFYINYHEPEKVKASFKKESQREYYVRQAYNSFYENHQHYSLLVFFRDLKVFSLHETLNEFNEKFDEGLICEGLITRKQDERPHFLHQTFAEYFVAVFIINNLSSFQDNPEAIEFIINTVLTEEVYENIRSFLNCLLLKRSVEEDVRKHFGRTFLSSPSFENIKELIYAEQSPLFLAVREYNDHILSFIFDCLEKNGHTEAVHYATREKKSLLYAAIEANHESTVQLLLENNAEINAKDSMDETPIFALFKNNPINKKILTLLIANNANIKEENKDGFTPIDLAIQTKDSMVVKLITQKFHCGLPACESQSTCLHFAVFQNNLDAIGTQLRNHFELVFLKIGTPLHLAVKLKNELIVERLLQLGADPDGSTFDQETPLHIAIQEKDENIVKILLKYHANVNRVNVREDTPLQSAIRTKNWNIMKLLMQSKPQLNTRNASNQTLLYTAILSGQKEAVQWLLDNGIDVNVKNRLGDTALHIAVFKNKPELVDLLLNSQNVDVNVKNDRGQTALHLSTLRDNDNLIKICKMLLENGADVTILDNKNKTPFDYAVRNERQDLIDVFENFSTR